MNDDLINNLKEALKHSPNNIPLKQQLADLLLQANHLNEAEKEYTELASMSADEHPKIGLATVFYQRAEYSKCNVLLEGLIDQNPNSLDALILNSKALAKEHNISKAIDVYKRVLAIDPGYFNEELDRQLKQTSVPSMEEDEEQPDSAFIEMPDINFEDVGGMADVKKEIELKIIKPLQHQELYKAYGKKTGGGILLYGPPGCGKTYIAKATAGQVNARFINVQLNDILDMWIGSSERNLHDIFELARNNTPCVLFIDEIDALGANRSDMKQSAGRHLINQLLQELDGIDNNNDGLLILAATNTPWHLDPAFRRPGRFDRIIFVPPPDDLARASILELKLKGKPINSIDYRKLGKQLKHYSGADLEAVIDIAIEEKLEASFADGIPKPLETKDLEKAGKRHSPSTQEWFATAKNFALFANNSGIYDDILSYLNLKK